jgi:hypothetical protein
MNPILQEQGKTQEKLKVGKTLERERKRSELHGRRGT